MRNGLAGDVMKTLAWITVTGPRHYNLGMPGKAWTYAMPGNGSMEP